MALAPALGRIFPGDTEPAESLREVTLDNLGPSLQNWMKMEGGDLGTTFFLSGSLYLLLTILVALTGSVASILSFAVRMRILKNMINALHKHIINLHLGFFTRRRTGDLVSRFSTDLTVTAKSMEAVVRGMIQSSVQIVVYMFVLMHTDAFLSVQILVVGCLHLVITRVLGGWVKHRTMRAYDGLAGLIAVLQESFQAIRVIKSFSAETHDSKRVEEEAESVRKNFFGFMVSRYAEEPIRILTDGLVAVAIIYLSYEAISAQRLTMAGVALFFYMASQLVQPVSELSRHFLSLYSIKGGFSKLIEIFETESDVRDGNKEVSRFQDRIVFKDVHFEYERGNPVLKNINFEVNHGETVAIVGPSGSGKSTLTDLILRLYDSSKGIIKFDDIDIREFSQHSYRKLFGVVSQESVLFNISIRDNITFGRPNDDKDLFRACSIANIDEFIQRLPDKFETHVGDRGIRLSGGQRQRITIARAIYAHPEILIMDEATSSLDSESEREVQAAIEDAIKGVTAIIVAHRLSTILHSDRIIVLNDGEIESNDKWTTF
jgi:subfamily B ATP-binding cassette protein MsbA